jgi:Zn-dependent protease with chaperone function
MSDLLLRGGTLALAWYLIVNAILSVAVAAWIERSTSNGHGASASGFWFAARVAPAAVALLFVAGVFVPSYWRYEPRESVEGFDITLTVLALAAAGLFAVAFVRGASAWIGAVRRTRRWMSTAQPLALAGTQIPAFEIDAAAPIIALVGVLRPKLLVTRGLVAALTDEELAASVAHEIGHSRAKDNLKRLVMRATPDLLAFTSCARAIERRWASAAEHRADRIAAAGHPEARCALASALVKVARLMPTITPIAQPISTLVDGGEIASRVERLLVDSAPVTRRGTPVAAWTTALLVAAACGVSYAPLLRLVHITTEILVRSLP